MSSTVDGTFTTFRDPAGQLSLTDHHAIRVVRGDYVAEAREFLASPLYRRWLLRGEIVGTEIVTDDSGGLTLRHPRISPASYPWEWSTPQWLAVAELTLRLCEESIREGWILKDATPLNVLFDGSRPVFVDVLSFERRDPKSPIWLAYGQFVRTFLLPLIAHRRLGWPLAASMFARDGYEPNEIYRSLSFFGKLHPRILWPVTLPALLEKRANDSAPAAQAQKVQRSPEIATHALLHAIGTLRRQVRNAAGTDVDSDWANYTRTALHYTAGETEQKQTFVRHALSECSPQAVLDIGCNTGVYSMLAAECGARVVALDSDTAAVGRLWARASKENAEVLPLVANIARPTPAVGWENGESFALLGRLERKFDLVLMLAVIHHLLLADQIPLGRIAALARRLTKEWLVLEWVPASDPMFQKMLRGRDHLYGSLSEKHLLEAFSPLFSIAERSELSNGRVLFLFRAMGC